MKGSVINIEWVTPSFLFGSFNREDGQEKAPTYRSDGHRDKVRPSNAHGPGLQPLCVTWQIRCSHAGELLFTSASSAARNEADPSHRITAVVIIMKASFGMEAFILDLMSFRFDLPQEGVPHCAPDESSMHHEFPVHSVQDRL